MGENNLPWFKMYPQRFMGDENVQLMGPTELGVYMAMLLHQWKAGAVPDDPKMVARICRGGVDEVREAWALVRPCFDDHPEREGYIIQARMEAEREAALNRREAARKAAKARSEGADRGEDGRFRDANPADEPAPGGADDPAAAGADGGTDGGASDPASSPAMRASDASEVERYREQQEEQTTAEEQKQRTTSPRVRLRDWLGEYEVAVTSFHDAFGQEKSTWAAAVWGQFVSGTREEVWRGVPREDRPTLMAAAMWSYIGDAEEYDNRLFQSYLERQVREYWEAGESDRGDLSAADDKIIQFREEIEHVDLGAAG